VFFTSAVDTLSSASLSTRAAQSSASLTWRGVLSRTATTSWAEVPAVSIATARVASAAVAVSHA
jgi:hypothetical protein